MNETLEVIKNRRSIRKYKFEQITDSELQTILDAAFLAPIGEPKGHFTIIQNKDLLDRMVDSIKENFVSSGSEIMIKKVKDPLYHTFYNAPTVILISADETAPLMEIQCGLAAQNIMLAAESLNIGSCLILSSGILFKTGKSNEFKRELGIPDGYNFVCTIALGYKYGDDPVTPPRDKNIINYIK
ncbi:MAG TPA: nitroreductase [Firmicutes bacterium]|jgi:nitroreductase|nr:nitroreductase [Bacillota bacterium]